MSCLSIQRVIDIGLWRISENMVLLLRSLRCEGIRMSFVKPCGLIYWMELLPLLLWHILQFPNTGCMKTQMLIASCLMKNELRKDGKLIQCYQL